MKGNNFKYPLFVRGDFDGFIGLFIDNLVNLLIITSLCLGIGMSNNLVFGRILPSTALSVFAGNLFYSWQARRLARKEKRRDVTALPYGINTVSLLAFFSLIIAPIYLHTNDAELAWKVGVISCLISGIFEGIGAMVGERIRRITPRAALLSTLSGIAIVFIALQFTLQIWDRPLIAFIPLAIILIEYFSHIKLPFKIPAGFYAMTIGTILAWATGAMSYERLADSITQVELHIPDLMIVEMFRGVEIARILPYLSISIPMGLMSFFATLQNIESASAAGDTYPATPVLAMNGIGTIIGSLFGSPFPTTVYIGHPGWKGLGARTGYSILNGFVISLICFTGVMSVIVSAVPIEAGYPILLWIGVVITAQAFQMTPKAHAPAIALGLLPAIAAWGLSLLRGFIGKSMPEGGADIDAIIVRVLPDVGGIVAFSEGALFSSMFLTAMCVYLIEKDLKKSFLWSIPLIIFSFFGFINSPRIGIGMAPEHTFGYILLSATLWAMFFYTKHYSPDK